MSPKPINQVTCSVPTAKLRFKNKTYDYYVLWRTINLGQPVIALTSKCEAGIMFN
jgi:hypothetical protein